MRTHMYMAVDGSGDFFLYRDKPVRDQAEEAWNGEVYRCVGFRYEDGVDLEDIPARFQEMTWADEPVLVILNQTIEETNTI